MSDERVKNYEYVEINELGRRCGEKHHRSTLTDHDIELIRELRERHRIPLGVLAEKFETSIGHISNICNYRRRNQVVTEWVKVARPAEPDAPTDGD